MLKTNLETIEWGKFIRGAAIILVAVILIWVLRWLVRRFFRRLQKEQKNLHLTFLEKLLEGMIFVAVVILALSAFGGTNSVWQTLLGGTAVISAVVAFAAQDVIKDVLAGMMISLYKPFEIGSRIELEDGTAGIVEDITMRHVVLIGLDSVRIVIPNSRLNAMRLSNFSYHTDLRSVQFRFPIGYDSDVELAKKVIAQAIEECEYTVPGKKSGSGEVNYGPVYFLELADSALIMAVTVYYYKTSATEAVKSEINTRVREALTQNGIEIPYNYVNVITLDKK